jgi:hypothetical protein
VPQYRGDVLIGRLAPDHKMIADFRKDNGAEIRKLCAKSVALCRQMGVLQSASVAIDGSKFNAVNNRDRNFTHAKMARRMVQIDGRYLRQLDSADRQEPSEAISIKTTRIKEKIARLKQEMSRLEVLMRSCATRRINRYRSPIQMPVRWPPADAGLLSSATMSRSR